MLKITSSKIGDAHRIHDLAWSGPFAFEEIAEGPSVLDQSGVYIVAVQCDERFYAHFVGETDRSFRERLSEHFRCFSNGEYWIFDSNETLESGRLGRPVYNPECGTHFASVRNPTVEWTSLLRIFIGPTPNYSVKELKELEADLCYRFSAVPNDPSSLFFDHVTRHNRINAPVVIKSSFEGFLIEGLHASIRLSPGEVPELEGA